MENYFYITLIASILFYRKTLDLIRGRTLLNLKSSFLKVEQYKLDSLTGRVLKNKIVCAINLVLYIIIFIIFDGEHRAIALMILIVLLGCFVLLSGDNSRSSIQTGKFIFKKNGLLFNDKFFYYHSDFVSIENSENKAKALDIIGRYKYYNTGNPNDALKQYLDDSYLIGVEEVLTSYGNPALNFYFLLPINSCPQNVVITLDMVYPERLKQIKSKIIAIINN